MTLPSESGARPFGYDPATHRAPTPREQFDDHPYYSRGDRVCMTGTDLCGTALAQQQFVDDPKVLVDWDYYTPEEGMQSWISPTYLVLVARRR